MDINELVAKELHSAIAQTVKERLSGYNTPLSKMVDEVVSSQSQEIKSLLREAITEAVSKDDFRAEVKSAFVHTLARSLMNDFKGEIEKQANALRQQADFRARVVIAIEKIVSESGV